MTKRTANVNLLAISAIVLLCLFETSIAFPAEQPTKFSLNTGDVSSQATVPESRLDRGLTLTSETQNNVAAVISQKAASLNQAQKSLEAIQSVPVVNTRPNSRETVRLEAETDQALLERPVSKPFMGILEALFRPTPLVDNIQEKEKFGNSGDKFIGIGRALVNSFEGFSNFLNAVIDLPRNAAKKTSRGITDALNHVGGRLVGLE